MRFSRISEIALKKKQKKNSGGAFNKFSCGKYVKLLQAWKLFMSGEQSSTDAAVFAVLSKLDNVWPTEWKQRMWDCSSLKR